jgi:hypothetical protein
VVDATLLQALADRLAGLPTNGHHAGQFTEPLATLWRALDADTTGSPSGVFATWAGSDPARIDLASEILKLSPGAPPPPDPWTIYTLKDAYKPRPPLTYIIADMLITPSLCMVYGAPGVMKSMLVADLMVCVAGGLEWLPPLNPKESTARRTTAVPTLWLDFDNGRRRTDERFDALGHTRNLPDDAPLYYVSMPSPWLDASDAQAVADLKARIIRLGAKLVVIDNLGTITGKAEENTGDMVQVMANLRAIVEATGAAIIILHHQRKSNGMGGRAGETVRGHSSIEAALDLALLVEREEHSDNITVRSTKTRDVDVYPFGAFFRFTHRPGSKELVTAQMLGVEVEDNKSQNAVKAAIIDVVTARRPITQKDLTTEVKKLLPDVGINRIRATADSLVALGTLIQRQGNKTSYLYDLP